MKLDIVFSFIYSLVFLVSILLILFTSDINILISVGVSLFLGVAAISNMAVVMEGLLNGNNKEITSSSK